MTHKTGGLRGKLRTLSIVGLVLGMLVTGAVLSLFFLRSRMWSTRRAS